MPLRIATEEQRRRRAVFSATLIAGNGVIQQSDAGVRDPKLSERQIVNNSTAAMSLP